MKLENGLYRLEIDERNGAIRRLLDKEAGLELIAEPRLAENFRLLVPVPQLEANYVLSGRQSPPAVERTPDGVVLRWRGPLSAEHGPLDLDVTVHVELADRTVRSRIVVENRTEFKLAEVWHGGLGGIMGLGDRKRTRVLLPDWGAEAGANLFQDFPESLTVSSLGAMRFPEFYLSYPHRLAMPWADMYNPELGRGVYYACHDVVPRRNTIRFEMHPGLARNRLSGNWPTDEEMAAMAERYPAGIVMHWVHMPYTPPGETFESPPVVLQCHSGDWHEAARIYRAWFLSNFRVRRPDESWLRQQQAVQAAMFLLPEGSVKITFKDIPRWAADAREHGVETVMICGWNVGGHDNQYPNYAPDPRLGTWDELKEAIAECHRMGVRVLFFANIQCVDRSTDWYRKELHRYRALQNAKSEMGIWGWGMGTLSARMGYTCPPTCQCEPAFAEYRRIIVEQMRKLAEIGADGIHFDKVWGGELDFHPALELPPDQAHAIGIIRCLEETLESCRNIRPDFCLGVESDWDRLLSYCDAWWLWYDMLDHVASMKYAFPEAIRYGYQLLIGPVRYSASMSDDQLRQISQYIAEVLRIRGELKDTIFLGEFLDTLEVSVEAAENLKYNTHRNPNTGKRACVLVNLGQRPVQTTVSFQGNAGGRVSIHRPFKEVQRQTSPATVLVDGERFAVVVEQ